MAAGAVIATRAPERVETARLLLRRPRGSDAGDIFSRYSADRDVTRYVGWAAHNRVEDARAFLAFSDEEWGRWPAGPYLAYLRVDGALVGGTGFSFETPFRAMTGYVFAKDAWGLGYATEALNAIVAMAPEVGVRRLYAVCHVDHRASARVLEKCGFTREGTLRRYAEFPNLAPGEPQDVLCYSTILEIASSTPAGF